MSEAEEDAEALALRQSEIIIGLMAEVKTLRERHEGMHELRRSARTRMVALMEEDVALLNENIELDAEVQRLRARVAELEAQMPPESVSHPDRECND